MAVAVSARENVELVAALSAARRRTGDAAERALDAFGLRVAAPPRRARSPGGEQQRVAIAAAAAAQAQLVLADEPTAELDEANEQLVLAALRRLRDDFGSTVVVVTHSVTVADAADRVVEIAGRPGRVTEPALVRCRAVSVVYGAGAQPRRALDGVDLEIASRRAPRSARPLGIGQDDAAARSRRPRGADVGRRRVARAAALLARCRGARRRAATASRTSSRARTCSPTSRRSRTSRSRLALAERRGP